MNTQLSFSYSLRRFGPLTSETRPSTIVRLHGQSSPRIDKLPLPEMHDRSIAKGVERRERETGWWVCRDAFWRAGRGGRSRSSNPPWTLDPEVDSEPNVWLSIRPTQRTARKLCCAGAVPSSSKPPGTCMPSSVTICFFLLIARRKWRIYACIDGPWLAGWRTRGGSPGRGTDRPCTCLARA